MASPGVLAQSRITSPGSAVWLAKVLRIEDTRRDEPAFLDSLLDCPDPAVRARAAIAVGRIGARSHLAHLRQRTSDGDSAVAANVWFALALLRDSAAVTLAPAALRTAAGSGEEAARLLGELGDVGRSAMVTALNDATLSPRVLRALLLAAARLRPVPAAAVIPYVVHADTGVAWRAAYVLARGRSAAGVRALLAVASSNSEMLREQVARGLARGAAGDSLADSAVAVLRRLASDAEPRVRVNAARALSSYGPSARSVVVALLHDVDAGVRLAAAQALPAVLDSTAAPWDAAFAADTGLTYRVAVAEGAAGKGLSLGATRAWRRAADWRLRAATVSGDAMGSADSAALRLRPWLADRDPRVRAAGASALAALMDSTSARATATGALRDALFDRDPLVRAAALSGLSVRATVADFPRALDAYRRSAVDRDADARLAFWQFADSALTRAGGSVPDSIERALSALARPRDPLERIAASRIPRFAAWADSAGNARPLEWYQARAREVLANPFRTARIQTDRGTIELVLFASDAPLTVYNFASLAARHYFDGQRFHRVVPNFVIQGGDPRGDGNGGPGYAIRDELNRRRYLRGTLGMALSGPNTGGSQFFVTHSPQPHLDGGYTVFGQLRSGFDTLDRIVQGDRIVRITVR